jgi:vitamin B12 transporter
MKQIVLLLFAVLSFSVAASAQNKAEVQGHITDEHGAAIKDAEVNLRSRSGPLLAAVTDETGAYSFRSLLPGNYILEVKANGFADFASEEISLTRGQTITTDVRLSAGALNETVTVTASGTPQRADEVSKAMTTVGEDEIETRQEISLPEALRQTPGLRVQQQGSPGVITSIRFRGQRNSDTAILLDGLRVRDSADINGSALPFLTDLTATGFDRAEILRGSGSSIYGTNAIGGVINLVPNTGSGDLHLEAGFEGGSLALFREHVRGAGGIGQRAGFSFGLTRLDVRRGVDGHDQYGNTAGMGRFQFEVTPAISIAANFYGSTSNAITNNNPRPLTPFISFRSAIPNVTFAPDANNPDQGRRNSIWVAAVRLTHAVSQNWSYSLAYQKVETRRRNYNGPKIDPSVAFLFAFGDFEFNSINNGGTDTFDARANIRAGRSNLITAGFEFERETLFQRFISSFGAPDGTTDRQNTFAFFVQDQIRLMDDRLQISIAARSQWFTLRQADRPGFLSAIAPKTSVTGDAAIAYFIRSTSTKLRGHLGNGFRAPSLFERFGEGAFASGFTRFGDPTLRAEQSIAVDAGLDQRLAHDRLSFGATYFYTRLQRAIDFQTFGLLSPPGPLDPLGLGRFGGYLNFPGGVSRGLETYFEAAPRNGTTIRAAYTFTNADRFLSGVGLQTQYVTPKHLFGLSVIQRYRAFNLAFDLNHTGEYIGPVFPVDLRFPGFTKADLFGSYRRSLNDRVRMKLFAGVDNLFDRKYFENGFRAPGATGRGGISFSFQ